MPVEAEGAGVNGIFLQHNIFNEETAVIGSHGSQLRLGGDVICGVIHVGVRIGHRDLCSKGGGGKVGAIGVIPVLCLQGEGIEALLQIPGDGAGGCRCGGIGIDAAVGGNIAGLVDQGGSHIGVPGACKAVQCFVVDGQRAAGCNKIPADRSAVGKVVAVPQGHFPDLIAHGAHKAKVLMGAVVRRRSKSDLGRVQIEGRTNHAGHGLALAAQRIIFGEVDLEVGQRFHRTGIILAHDAQCVLAGIRMRIIAHIGAQPGSCGKVIGGTFCYVVFAVSVCKALLAILTAAKAVFFRLSFFRGHQKDFIVLQNVGIRETGGCILITDNIRCFRGDVAAVTFARFENGVQLFRTESRIYISIRLAVAAHISARGHAGKVRQPVVYIAETVHGIVAVSLVDVQRSICTGRILDTVEQIFQSGKTRFKFLAGHVASLFKVYSHIAGGQDAFGQKEKTVVRSHICFIIQHTPFQRVRGFLIDILPITVVNVVVGIGLRIPAFDTVHAGMDGRIRRRRGLCCGLCYCQRLCGQQRQAHHKAQDRTQHSFLHNICSLLLLSPLVFNWDRSISVSSGVAERRRLPSQKGHACISPTR